MPLALERLSHRRSAAAVDGITAGKPLPPEMTGEIALGYTRIQC